MSQCDNEDRQGRRCALGAGHTAKCRFGSARLTEGQQEALQSLLAGPRETDGSTPALVSLVRLGLVHRRFIGMRWSAWALSPHGRRVAEELPA